MEECNLPIIIPVDLVTDFPSPEDDTGNPCSPSLPTVTPESCDGLIRGWYNSPQTYEAMCYAGYYYQYEPSVATVPAYEFFSSISQEEADVLAATEAALEAEAALDCILKGWFNEEQSYEAVCPVDYDGDPVTVSVPAGQFFSEVSQAVANDAALASAQGLAEAALECTQVVFYNVEQTANCSMDEFGNTLYGEPSVIPAGSYSSVVSQIDADNIALAAAEAALVCHWENTEQTATCAAGYTGSPVTVSAGSYSSSVSQADADALALAAAEAALVCTPVVFVTPVFNGVILSFDFQSDGKVICVGQFTAVGAETHTRIARLNANGTLDSTFTASLNNDGLAVVVLSDDSIMVGGRFGTVNGVTRRGLAHLNSDGTLDTAFNANLNNDVGIGEGAPILVDSSGRILVCHSSSTFLGVSSIGFNRMNSDLTLDTSLVVDATYTSLTQAAEVLELAGGVLMLGAFNNPFYIQPAFVGHVLTKMSDVGVLDPTFNNTTPPMLTGNITGFAQQSTGKFLVLGFGDLATTGPISLGTSIARMTTNGQYDSSFTGVVTGGQAIYDLIVNADDSVYISGIFTTAGGNTRHRMAKFTVDGTLDSFNPDVNGSVTQMKLHASRLWAVGAFSSVGGATRNSIVQLNLDGTLTY